MKQNSLPALKRNEYGFTLMETAVALSLFALVVGGSLHLLLTRAVSMQQTSQQRAAVEWAEAGMDTLTTASEAQLPSDAGSFDVVGSAEAGDLHIAITNDCTEQTCDFVIDPAPSIDQRTSPARGVPWTKEYSPPRGSQILFVRRWRVDPKDAALGLRQITLAVLLTEDSTQPLVVQQADADLVVRP